jgi:hypothetical protein
MEPSALAPLVTMMFVQASVFIVAAIDRMAVARMQSVFVFFILFPALFRNPPAGNTGHFLVVTI